MFRQLVAMLDEPQSRETVKHVLRAMKENTRLEKHREVPCHLLAKRKIERFAATPRARLRNENVRLSKEYMRQLASRIEVGDRQIRVSAPESTLAEGLLDSGSAPAAGVSSFVRGWWTAR